MAGGKAAALTLFPTLFITLFSWATAGSTSGNTAEPMRASAWIWLALQQSNFHINIAGVSAGSAGLTFLPLAGLLLPIWAIRRSWRSALENFPDLGNWLNRSALALCYGLIALLIALASATNGVAAIWWSAAINAAAITLIATARWGGGSLSINLLKHIAAIWLGLSLISLAFMYLLHWHDGINLAKVINTGYLGGLSYLVIQILYLPNLALAIFGFLTGSGFSFGPATIATATSIHLQQIPALPLFAALPTATSSVLRFGEIIWLLPLLLTALVLNLANRKYGFGLRLARLAPHIFIWPGLIFICAYLASGELVTPGLNRVGLLPIRSTAIAAATSLTSFVLIALGYGLVQLSVRRRK